MQCLSERTSVLVIFKCIISPNANAIVSQYCNGSVIATAGITSKFINRVLQCQKDTDASQLTRNNLPTVIGGPEKIEGVPYLLFFTFNQ